MYKPILALLLLPLFLFSCSSKPQISSVSQPVKSTPAIIKNTALLTNDPTPVYPKYPADSTYPARILISGGVFHEDEVDPQSASYQWKGLFKSGGGYYIANTRISLSKANDAVLDDENQKTGWDIKPEVKDTALLLISGLDFLGDRHIDSISLGKLQIMPGEQVQFTCHNVTYTLYATGKKAPENLKSNTWVVSNYKLYLKAVINGKSYNQLLVAIADFDDAMTTIQFAGDIDGDDRPDFIIDTTNDYNAEVPTLYLSKPASKGNLLKVVGMHTSVGC